MGRQRGRQYKHSSYPENFMYMPRARLFAATLLLCVTAVVTGCSSTALKVRTHVDPGADFSRYRTYGFVAEPGTRRGGATNALTIYFMQAVRHEMDARGYQYTEESPDLLVNFNANPRATAEETTSISPQYGYSTGYYAYRAQLYGLPVIGFEDEETVKYRVGTGNVDVVDARKKMLIWVGIAEGRFTEEMLHDAGPVISAAVADMFAQYPARAAP
jgi:hypothetical protein